MAALSIALCTACGALAPRADEPAAVERWIGEGDALVAECDATVGDLAWRELPLPGWFIGGRVDWVVVIEHGGVGTDAAAPPVVAILATSDGLVGYHGLLRFRWFQTLVSLQATGFFERPIWTRAGRATSRRIVERVLGLVDAAEPAAGESSDLLVIARHRGRAIARHIRRDALAGATDLETLIHELAATEFVYARTQFITPVPRTVARLVERRYVTWYDEPAAPPVLFRCTSDP